MRNFERVSNYSLLRGVISSNSRDDIEPSGINTSGGVSSDSSWREFIFSTGPHSYMWTHSYLRPYSDRVAIDGLWDSAKYINRKLWGPRWRKRGAGLVATVVAEQHKISQDVRGRLHFHLLVQNAADELCERRFTEAAYEAADWLKDSAGRKMSSVDRVNVSPVNSMDGVADYLSKDLAHAGQSRGDNIFFLRPSGLEGMVLRERSRRELERLH